MGCSSKCIDMVDKELAKHNTKLVVDLISDNVFITTTKIRKLRDGKSAKKVFATFCPFCGERLVAI